MSKKLTLKQKTYSSLRLEVNKNHDNVVVWVVDQDENNHMAVELTERQARELASWIINNTGI